ncbi:hypothetical protein AMTR_s00075p00173960 [Amborella trichopoda]|uniref:Uncharacterized protein n=1 Tax=Amborella trichopoda TaxID=13333 RepID=W1PAI8_AMBTC|nr:hypothetical protein AMTR_s00075p00173960 [Amborella trichopoda]
MVAEHNSLRDELERVRSILSSSFVAPTVPGPSLDCIRDLERCVDRYGSERVATPFSRCESLCEGAITILCLESVTVSGIYSDDKGSEAGSTEIGGRGEQSYKDSISKK